MSYLLKEDKATLVLKAKRIVDREVESKQSLISEVDKIVADRGYNDISMGQRREQLVTELNFALAHQAEFAEHEIFDSYGHLTCREGCFVVYFGNEIYNRDYCERLIRKAKRILG